MFVVEIGRYFGWGFRRGWDEAGPQAPVYPGERRL